MSICEKAKEAAKAKEQMDWHLKYIKESAFLRKLLGQDDLSDLEFKDGRWFICGHWFTYHDKYESGPLGTENAPCLMPPHLWYDPWSGLSVKGHPIYTLEELGDYLIKKEKEEVALKLKEADEAASIKDIEDQKPWWRIWK